MATCDWRKRCFFRLRVDDFYRLGSLSAALDLALGLSYLSKLVVHLESNNYNILAEEVL